MSVAIRPESGSVLMENIRWSTFEALLADGHRAAMTAVQPVLCTAVTAVATVLFALA